MPTQALYVLNAPFFHEQAVKLADHLLRGTGRTKSARAGFPIGARSDRRRPRNGIGARRFLAAYMMSFATCRPRKGQGWRGPPGPESCWEVTSLCIWIKVMVDQRLAGSRRGFLRSAVAGSILMPGILHELLAADQTDPVAPRPPHFPGKAKSVIFLFMSGGVSHVDSFDPKPRLFTDHGKQVTLDHPETRNRPGYEKLFLKRPGWEFTPRGQSGTEVSSLFPRMGDCVDEIALVRSMYTSHSNHYNATLGMHTGSFAFARPSLGAWVSYGLGTENRDLPSFVVIAPEDAVRGDPGLGVGLLAGCPSRDPDGARPGADSQSGSARGGRSSPGARTGRARGAERVAPGDAQ